MVSSIWSSGEAGRNQFSSEVALYRANIIVLLYAMLSINVSLSSRQC